MSAATSNLNQLVHEYEEALIRRRTLQAVLAKEEQSLSAIERLLDLLTSPREHDITPTVDSRGHRCAPVGLLSYRLHHIVRRAATQRQLWTMFMADALTMYAQQADEVCRALCAAGRGRCYLARECRALFPGKTDVWTKQHSVEVIDGWFLDTNLNLKSKRELTSVVAGTLGLAQPTDFEVDWTGSRPMGLRISTDTSERDEAQHRI